MKKLAALIGVFLLVISCTPESDNPRIHFELLPVESVEMPVEFHVNVENEIVISFIRPTECHAFDSFYYDKDGFTRTVAVQSFVIEKSGCTTLTNAISEQTLRFKPVETGTYLFKFWKGKDANGVNIYEEISVDVQ